MIIWRLKFTVQDGRTFDVYYWVRAMLRFPRPTFPKSVSRHETLQEQAAEYTCAYLMRVFGLVSVDRYDSVAVVENLEHYSVDG